MGKSEDDTTVAPNTDTETQTSQPDSEATISGNFFVGFSSLNTRRKFYCDTRRQFKKHVNLIQYRNKTGFV
jgi:hypothetical protein